MLHMPAVFAADLDFQKLCVDFYAHPAFEGLERPDDLWRLHEEQTRALNEHRREADRIHQQSGDARRYDFRQPPTWQTPDSIADAKSRAVYADIQETDARLRQAIERWKIAEQQAIADVRAHLDAARARFYQLRSRGLCPSDPEWGWSVAFQNLATRVGVRI